MFIYFLINVRHKVKQGPEIKLAGSRLIVLLVYQTLYGDPSS